MHIPKSKNTNHPMRKQFNTILFLAIAQLCFGQITVTSTTFPVANEMLPLVVQH